MWVFRGFLTLLILVQVKYLWNVVQLVFLYSFAQREVGGYKQCSVE